MKRLMQITKIHCVNTEDEAQEVIDEALEEGDLKKKSIEVKQKKSKGQVIAECLKVTTVVDVETEWFEDAGGEE